MAGTGACIATNGGVMSSKVWLCVFSMNRLLLHTYLRSPLLPASQRQPDSPYFVFVLSAS